MKIIILKFLKAAALVSFGLVVGVVFGLREGAIAFMQIDSIPRGVLATGQLKALDKGNLRPSKELLEMEIDQALYHYSLIKEQWWHPLYKAHLLHGASPADLDTYVQRVAEYRVKNPGPPFNPAMFDQVPKGEEEYKDFYHELSASHRDRINRIEATVKAHAASDLTIRSRPTPSARP